MRILLLLSFLIFLGMKPKEKKSTILRSFYTEMKALEKPLKVDVFAAVNSTILSTTSSSFNVTIPATTVNNLLVIGIYTLNNPAINLSSISDNGGNTYATTSSVTSGTNTFKIIMAYAVQTASATTVTITHAGSINSEVAINEYSGGYTTNAAVHNQTQTGSGNSANLSVSTMTLTGDGLVVACLGKDYSPGGQLTSGSNYTLYGTPDASRMSLQHRLVATTSETAPANASFSQNWVEIAIGFKAVLPQRGIRLSAFKP